MNSFAETSQIQAYRLLGAVAGAFVLYGMWGAGNSNDLAIYLLVVSCGLLPPLLWVREGSRGIPILPVVAIGHIVYFALPVLNSSALLLEYTMGELYRGAATAGLFLLVAGLVTLFHGRPPERSRSFAQNATTEIQIVRLMFFGLTLGLVMQVAIVTGLFAELGTAFGTIRSITLTAFTLSCFLMGVTRGEGLLSGAAWRLAVICFICNIFMDWASLFLAGSIVKAIAFCGGYVLTTRRVPWASVIAFLGVVFVLHAGKGEMRAKYWYEDANSGQTISVSAVPGRIIEWMGTGLSALAPGGIAAAPDSGEASIVERASLLQMLVRAQRQTPDTVPYLGGQTYWMFPQMLIPRFLDPDKPASQAPMDLLNRRYGLISIDEESKTAIGWGLLPESYANFGYPGVVAMAALLGFAASGLTRWSARSSSFSLPTLIAIAALINMISLETDFSYLMVNMWQSSISACVFYGGYMLLLYRSRLRDNVIAFEAQTLRRPP
jgi:hypothetical protein